MSKDKRPLPARRDESDLSDVPTDELINAIFEMNQELTKRGVDLLVQLDARAKWIVDKRLETADRLVSIPDAIAKLISFIDGAALAGSGNNLRSILFSPNPVSGRNQQDFIGMLTGLYNQALSDWHAFAPEIADNLEAEQSPLIQRYVDAMQLLKAGADNGEALRNVSGTGSFVTSLDTLRKLAYAGRPEYPETKQLRQMKAERLNRFAGQWVKMGHDIVDSLKLIENPTDLERSTLEYFEQKSNDERKEILKKL